MAVTELQRREHYVVKFTAQEKQLFLPIVSQCLENRPDKRSCSVMLVQELRLIESTLPSGGHVSAPIEHLRQQLSAKEEECRQKDEAIKENSKAMKVKDKQLAAKEAECRLKDKRNREKDEVIGEKTAIIQAQQAEIQRLQLKDQLAVTQQVS